MERQNVKISLPKETLHKAKIVASDRYKIVKQRQLVLLARGYDFSLGKTMTWSRDELHKRWRLLNPNPTLIMRTLPESDWKKLRNIREKRWQDFVHVF